MRRWAAALAATAVLVVGAAPASAKPVGTIDPAARAAAEAAITARLGDLNAHVTLVNQAAALTAGDRSALSNELTSTISGLTALATTITNETVPASFRAEAAEVFSTYRVYAVVVPQVHLVRAADELSGVVVPGLQKVEEALRTPTPRAAPQ